MMAADTLERVGIARGDYVIKVNNRKVLDGVMEAIGLAGDDKAGQRLTVLRAIDKLDRLGVDGVRQLLGAGRKDESGDFTKGAGLEPDQIDRVHKYFAYQVKPNADQDRVDFWDRFFVDWADVVGDSERGREGIAELHAIMRLCSAAGYGNDRVRADPSVVRGLEYYTGPVYEAELTFTVTSDDGQAVRFGSVAGGGRYDGLVGRFRSEPVPATGFSIGVSRLFAALKAVNSPLLSAGKARPLVVVTVMDRERFADYQRMVSQLRALRGADGDALVRAEMYLGDARFNAQMKYADKRGAVCVVIQGSDEHARGEVLVKDLIVGAELASIAKDDREGYLRKQAEAQFSVPEESLGDAIRKVLARHA
jgi:histidyl-tRNA synthetase